MKEKSTHIVVVFCLLILVVSASSVFIAKVLEQTNFGKLYDDVAIKVQTNAAILHWTLKTTYARYKQILENNNSSNILSAVLSCHRSEILVNHIFSTIVICAVDTICKDNNNSTSRRSNFEPKDTQFSSEVVTFMVAITFAKLVICVIAYQQLLHNGIIIIQNLYHKRIRHFEDLTCNRSYQLKSGHGLGGEENYLSKLLQSYQIPKRSKPHERKYQLLKRINNTIKYIGADNFDSEKYASIQGEQKGSTSFNKQLYHQQKQLKDFHYYQQFEYDHYHNSKHHRNHRKSQHYYHQNYRCFYQRDNPCFQGNCHQMQKKKTNEHHLHRKMRVVCDKTLSENSSVSPISRQSYSSSSSSKFKKVRKSNIRSGDIVNSQQTAPLIPTLISLSPSICCWKTTCIRKRRKRKGWFGWDKYDKNCMYLIWRTSCSPVMCCCCCDDFCDSICRIRYNEYFHIHCSYSCACSFFSKTDCCCNCICEHSPSITQHTFHKSQINRSSARLNKNRSHQLNIISRRSSRQASRNWCIDASHHGKGRNLLRTLNAVKEITSAVPNRIYKGKLKKNLVWLFIGLVWLEGPKLISCSIRHNNNNDVTTISGNQTTNKISSGQNSSSDSSAESGGRNGSRSKGGSSSNTNGPGPSSRPDTAETKGQSSKSGNSFKKNNSLEHSNNMDSYNINRTSIEQPLEIKKQYHHPPTFRQQREPYVVSRTAYTSDRPTNTRSTLTTPTLFEREEAIPDQSDIVRLESIKRQILTKLGLTEKPNVTHPLPKQFIWDTIYRADGIKSVSDFDFNDNHRTQEHMRLTSAVLEPPPVILHHDPPIVDSITDTVEIRSNRLEDGRNINTNNSSRGKDINAGKSVLSARFRYINLNSENVSEDKEQKLSKYQRKHKLKQQQQMLRSYKNSNNQVKNKFTEPDYFDGDDFFGSTQEIITFAEKGKIFKKHRLVEFSPPSNKIPKQKLQIRNAEIHIRIEKVLTRTSITKGQLEHRYLHRHKYASSREPNLKIWIFQLIGKDFSSKGFDQVATLCTSLSVDHNVMGWQKLDITETVQFWYNKHPRDKLRLLIDCTGCGTRYVLHLFDRKLHHSLLSPPPTSFRHQNYENDNNYKHNITAMNPEYADNNQSQQHYYHYRQYNHHRYRRKKRASWTHHALVGLNASQILNLAPIKQKPPALWLRSSKYRKRREIKYPNSSQEELEGISYEVGAEFHLEDRLNPNRPFLVLHTESTRSRRVRRRAVDCSGAIHGQCCKESFYVSFKALGWDDWIIAPRGYFANYCRGDCTGPYRTPDTFQTFHAHFIEEYRKMGLLNGMQPCCAPMKFSSMSLIYYGDDGIIKRDLPKMVVDECGCP